MATFAFVSVIGLAIGSLTLFIFARPLTRWVRVHFK